MSSQSRPREYKLSRGYTNYIFILLFLLYFFDYTDRMVVTSLFPYIKKEWNISDAQCGLLVSAIYWSIIIFVFPVSILVDRWSRKKTIGIMAVLWSLATGACALAGNFFHLTVARTVIGIGEAGYSPGGTAMISGLYPEEKRSAMMGIWNASIPLGSAVGIALGGVIATHLGWRSAFGLVALPGMIVAVIFFFIKDYKTVDLVRNAGGEGEGGTRVKMSKLEIVRVFSRTPSLILTYFGFAGMLFVMVSIMTWMPTYYHRVYNMPEDQSGIKAGSIMLLSLIGGPVGGFLVDRWRRKRVNARCLFPAITSLVSAALLFTAFMFFSGNLQYAIILIFGFTFVMFVPAAAAVTQDVVHPGLRAVSYALCVIIQNLFGSSTGPIVIGAVSDAYDIQTALMILPVFLILSSVLFFMSSFFYQGDLEKAEKVVLEAEN